MDFEWDPGKRLANLEKHGLDFRDTAAVFSGPLLVKTAASGGEARFLAIGALAGREVAVIYTMRGDRNRTFPYGEREMAKGKRTGRRYERHSAKALKMLASESDLARIDAVSERELERTIANDPDWANVPADWYKGAELVMPRRKKLITLRLDPDVVEWFRRQGAGYQTKINAVLRAFIGAQRGR